MASPDSAPDFVHQLAQRIDHTLLRPDATATAVVRLCSEARQHRFAAVCINPYWVELAARELNGTQVAVCTVIGFPLGASATRVKVFEAEAALAAGAREIDMVLNIGELLASNHDAVLEDIRQVVAVAHAGRAITKVILETALLSDDDKREACLLVKQAGAEFVKTSTGFASGGATVDDVRLMRATVGPEMGVKASGGIRTFADAQRMMEAGATRIGTSSGIRILDEARQAQ